METIKINEIVKKGVVCIVSYVGEKLAGNILEATLNVNFNKQEIWYLENEVGIGGTVSVEIVNKEKQEGNPSAGFWVNIIKVDMKSAVKGEPTQAISKYIEIQGKEKWRTPAEISAQTLTGIFCRNQQITADADGTKFVLEAYKYYLEALSNVKGL